jgi:hypothetical protein
MVLRPSEKATDKRTYPLTGRMVAPCGGAFQGGSRSDSAGPGAVQYKCSGKVWRGDPDWQRCGCARLNAPEIEARVWAEVSALLSDPGRLEALAAGYLGADGDTASQEAELKKLDRDATALQGRMTNAMATWIKSGSDQSIFDAAMEQLNEELAALTKRRDDIARYLAESEQAREQMTSLGGLAGRVSGRLGSMSLDEQREVLDLLDVRIEVLDSTKSPAIRITGTVVDFALGCDPGTTPSWSRCSPVWSQVEDYGQGGGCE